MLLSGTKRFSDELRDAVAWARPDLENTIKRGFTNAGVQRTRVSSAQKDSLRLDDVFFNVDDNTTVSLTELRVTGTPDMRLTSLQCGVQSMTMPMTLSLGTVRLCGRYESTNAALVRLLPVSCHGAITITLEEMRAAGTTGLHVSGDSFVPTVYDLSYNSQEITVKVEYPGHAAGDPAIVSQLTYTDVEKSIVKRFWRQLTYTLNSLISDQLRQILAEISIMDLLRGDADIVNELKDHSKNITSIANNIVNAVLQETSTIVGPQIATAGTSTGFSRKSLRGRRQWGGFSASEGWLGSLHSLRRKCHACIVLPATASAPTYVHALVEFADLKLVYGNYKIVFPNTDARGKVTLALGSNTCVLKLQLQALENRMHKIQIREFKHLQSYPTEIDVTGLGSLNNLVPEIATWALGTFRDRIVPKIEQDVTKALWQIRFNNIQL